MKSFSLLVLLSAVFSSIAMADDVYKCGPVVDKTNGLGIKSMKIVMDSEHPEALITITYVSGATKTLTADTEGDDRDGYKIAYKGGRAFLKGNSANVFDDYADTFSVLSCR